MVQDELIESYACGKLSLVLFDAFVVSRDTFPILVKEVTKVHHII